MFAAAPLATFALPGRLVFFYNYLIRASYRLSKTTQFCQQLLGGSVGPEQRIALVPKLRSSQQRSFVCFNLPRSGLALHCPTHLPFLIRSHQMKHSRADPNCLRVWYSVPLALELPTDPDRSHHHHQPTYPEAVRERVFHLNTDLVQTFHRVEYPSLAFHLRSQLRLSHLAARSPETAGPKPLGTGVLRHASTAV